MLAGRYPSDEFAELRPRLNWDRATGRLSARPGAQRLAVTSGGAIPDRGLYGVFLSSENPTRVGELDEEMVYESRVGEVFVLGASSWLIEDICAGEDRQDALLARRRSGEALRARARRGSVSARADFVDDRGGSSALGALRAGRARGAQPVAVRRRAKGDHGFCPR
jgi:hypothetical protein